MVPSSIVTHSNGGLSFPNANLAQMQILQKWESTVLWWILVVWWTYYGVIFYFLMSLSGNTVYCIRMCKYLRLSFTQDLVMKMFFSDSVVFWLVIEEEYRDSIPEGTVSRQEAFRSIGQLEAEKHTPSISILSNHQKIIVARILHQKKKEKKIVKNKLKPSTKTD